MVWVFYWNSQMGLDKQARAQKKALKEQKKREHRRITKLMMQQSVCNEYNSRDCFGRWNQFEWENGREKLR